MRGEFGVMTALHSPDIVAVPLERIVGRTRNVPVTGDVVRTARNVGICFGD
jgi:6-phosphofructokinase 1